MKNDCAGASRTCLHEKAPYSSQILAYMTKNEKAIKDNPNVTTEDLAKQFGVISMTLKHHIAKMREPIFVERLYYASSG
ncbi:hypothetical protein [Prevotella sp. OH937_COT-195]|uniref:hypothetical protein n=1 Tax=Prevotella sp. OH937_COT-195 TaxID=2491051 RepID=UPI000F6468B3|nr:hypothetical protein [Prevotella sp. OH937_COT-195]RRC98439.1 hypothetical protein EII32_09375 [Prevotella sp. OH937_COT-195]